jgi:hypothetical protein
MVIALNGTVIAEVEYTPSRENTQFTYYIETPSTLSSFPATFTDYYTSFMEVELNPP